MSINGIGSYQLSAASAYAEQTPHANAVESDGDVDRSRATAPIDNAGRNGLFSSAISQTLFQIGVTPTAANVATGAAPTGTQQQTLTAFTQNLFGALQTAGGNASSTGTAKAGAPTRSTSRNASNTSSSASASQGAQGLNLATGNTLQNRLQSLIQELGQNTAGTDESTEENQALTQLQQSFQDFVTSQNTGTQQQPTLTSFLQTLAQNLQDAPSSGNLINVQA
jgi:hypothetical protein